MKHFFYIFFTFCFICISALNANAQDLSEQSDKIQINSTEPVGDSVFQKIIELQQATNQKIQQAMVQKPEDISFIDKPDSRNVYTLLTLASKDAGLLTGAKGLGAYQTFDFGQARLISCQGNIGNKPVLVTALQVDINNGWQLKKPTILPTQSDLWFSEKIFYPIRWQHKRTDFYQEQVMFPMIYHLKDISQPFYLEKEISLTACQENNCQTQTKPYILTVESGKGYSTDVCAAIMNELAQSTFELPDDIKVSLHKNTQNVYQLVVDYPEKIDGFKFQISNEWDYTLIKESIQGQRVIVLFKPLQDIPPAEVISFKLLSSLGWFETTIKADDKPFVQDLVFFSWKTGFKNIFLFLFFSPFYLMFWSLRVKNKDDLILKIKRIKFIAFVFIVVLSVILYCQIPVVSFLKSVPVLCLQILLLIYLIYTPLVSINRLPLYLLIMPYPFLYDTILTFPKNQISAVLWSTLWVGSCLLPFTALKNVPQFFNALETAQKPILKIMRLPLFILLFWISGLLFVSFYSPVSSYTEKQFDEAIQSGKNVFVTVENKACLTCVLNQVSTLWFDPIRTLVQEDKMVLMSVKQDSPEGRLFLQKYDIPQGVSFYLLASPNRTEGMRIENHYLQTEDWYHYLSEIGIQVK